MTLQELLQSSNKIVFFGGAGVSTESGIPDFRGEQGIYQTVKEYGVRPEEIISHHYFLQDPQTFYRFYKEKMVYRDARPNAAHLALARLEEMGKLQAVVTQNIDGLHQAAGSKKVLELHGSIHRNFCMKCGAFYGLEAILQAEDVPYCAQCGGMIKPDVVLYEEGLDQETITQAVSAIAQAEVLIVGGTSLSVYPAASFIRYYQGDQLVLINKSATQYDSSADLLIHDSIGKVLEEVI